MGLILNIYTFYTISCCTQRVEGVLTPKEQMGFPDNSSWFWIWAQRDTFADLEMSSLTALANWYYFPLHDRVIHFMVHIKLPHDKKIMVPVLSDPETQCFVLLPICQLIVSVPFPLYSISNTCVLSIIRNNLTKRHSHLVLFKSYEPEPNITFMMFFFVSTFKYKLTL